MPRRRHLILGAAVLAALPAKAQPVKIRLGTATPSGGFPVYGAAFVDGVHCTDPALEVEAINTKGSTENVPMLEAGTLDIALVQGKVIHRRGPWRSFEAVEFATLEWVDWFNNRRLLEPIGNIPPAEAEQQYYATLDQPAMAA